MKYAQCGMEYLQAIDWDAIGQQNEVRGGNTLSEDSKKNQKKRC